MAKRNVTVQLDETVIHRAKVLAAKQSTSVSGLVTRALVDLVEGDDRYEEARRHGARHDPRRRQPRRGPLDAYRAPRTAARAVTLAAAAGRTFVDTNILLYAYDVADEHRHPVASERLGQLWAHGTGVISTQVLQEFYVVATRKLAQPLPRAAAREVIADYSTWLVVQVDPTLVLSASMLEERETLSFWDALMRGRRHNEPVRSGCCPKTCHTAAPSAP